MLSIGLPPPAKVQGDMKPYEDLTKASFFQIDIAPKRPKVGESIQLFTLESAFGDYSTRYMQILQDVAAEIGVDATVPPISKVTRIYAIVDTPVSEQFTSQYDESFISKITNVAGGGIAEIRQILGFRSAKDIEKALGKMQEQLGKGGVGEQLLSHVVGGAKRTTETVRKTIEGLGGGPFVTNLLLGHKIEFPKVWRDSNYAPSYTFTVRLYNTNPGSSLSTFKHIIAPLCALLLYVVPYSKDGYTYDWPFFCSADAPGLFSIKYGAITDLSVIKGGDTVSFGFTQVPAIVDLRLTITDLFSTMLGGRSVVKQTNIVDYLSSLGRTRDISAAFTFVPKQIQQLRTTLETLKTTRLPTPRIPPALSQAASVLEKEEITKTIEQQWPSTLPAPTPTVLDDLYSLTKDPEVDNIVRDYERALDIVKKIDNLIATIQKASSKTTTLQQRIEDLSSKIVIIKSKDPVVQYLLSNPTTSAILNQVLTQIAKRAEKLPNPLTTIINELRQLQPKRVRPYAERKLDRVLYSKSELAIKDDYPTATATDISQIAQSLLKTILDKAEEKIMGKINTLVA